MPCGIPYMHAPKSAQITVYPLYALADSLDRQPFDTSVLPFEIVDGVTVEDARPFFGANTFQLFREDLGSRNVAELEQIRYAIVHRFHESDDGESHNKSRRLVANLVAALRIIRQTRQT